MPNELRYVNKTLSGTIKYVRGGPDPGEGTGQISLRRMVIVLS